MLEEQLLEVPVDYEVYLSRHLPASNRQHFSSIDSRRAVEDIMLLRRYRDMHGDEGLEF